MSGAPSQSGRPDLNPARFSARWMAASARPGFQGKRRVRAVHAGREKRVQRPWLRRHAIVVGGACEIGHTRTRDRWGTPGSLCSPRGPEPAVLYREQSVGSGASIPHRQRSEW